MTTVALEDLRVAAAVGPVVDGVSLQIASGELLALVGESGAGKTTAALALLGHLRPGLRRTGGRVHVGDVDPLALPERQRSRWRATTVGYVAQAAGGGLDPRMRVERLLTETLRDRPRAERAARVEQALHDAGLDAIDGILRRYPHQLSGGQQQRVAIAMALTRDPQLLVLDEPTAGLDTTTQARILDAIDALRRRRPRAVLLISHDLALVAQRADRIAIMTAGRVLETGPTRAILAAPAHRYTRALRDAVPDLHAPAPARPASAAGASTVLAAEGLCATHRGSGGTVVAARDVTLRLRAGGCLALVGESGSGKTTIARMLAGLHRPDAGRILVGGESVPGDVRRRTPAQLRAIQLVPQDPQGTLNPHQPIRIALERPLRLLGRLDRDVRRQRGDALLRQVGLDSAVADRRPGQLSGGERQRVAIARALAAEPDVLICDEITTALDARTQARIVELLDELRARTGVALLLITHDLGLAAALADETIILRDGTICASGPTDRLLRAPDEPYARELAAAAPSLVRALAAPRA